MNVSVTLSDVPVAHLSECDGVRSLQFDPERGAEIFEDFDPTK